MFNVNQIKHLLLIIANIILVLFLLLLFLIVYNAYLNEETLKNHILSITENTSDFSIKRIVFYSSANTIDTDESSPWTFDSIYQYTDMAIYIENSKENGLYKNNTLKSLYIDNIKINTQPTYGSANLYFKPVSKFAQSSLLSEPLKDKLEFSITLDGEINLSEKPELYASCTTPITLSYINSNIKQDFTITDNSTTLSLDGSALKRAGILLSTIQSTISFDITLVNNSNQTSKCNVILEIPLQNDNQSIYDGYLVLDKEVDFKFYEI